MGHTHKDRAVTNNPIIGVLMQPFNAVKDDIVQVNYKDGYHGFISASHVKFLESGGARVVPVQYDLPRNDLHRILAQINGIYIPGESFKSLDNTHYTTTVM